ncbi:transposase [Algiphilus sp. W345]|uniref:Transposase n=1 Tax=Banduia mediterranea TaxID=3075609 RepID=A0ABU2WNK8_9GAMM|nr:transposase [Algiphilus sp. W345]MDT0499135.1 transposase [Algiphilus sp. W345]
MTLGIARLEELMRANQTLATVYTLKEQLQTLWRKPDEDAMRQALNAWCTLARATPITPLHRYAQMLQRHADGLCAYARFKLTTVRIEAGNVAGMIRKRARGKPRSGLFQLHNWPCRRWARAEAQSSRTCSSMKA